MKTAIQVLDETQLEEVAGGQVRVICIVSQEYVTCTGGGVTIRLPRTDGGKGGGGSAGGGTGGGNNGGGRGDNGGGRSGRRW